MMAAGGVDALPARDHRGCHAALATLLDESSDSGVRLWHRFGGTAQERATAAYSRQVDGVAPALWDLVNRGLLNVYDGPTGAGYVLDEDAANRVRRKLLRLPADEVSLVYRAGAAWAAAASTSRNIFARPASSPGSMRRVSRA